MLENRKQTQNKFIPDLNETERIKQSRVKICTLYNIETNYKT